MFRSMVGLILVMIALVGFAMLWWTLAITGSLLFEAPLEFTFRNGVQVFYS